MPNTTGALEHTAPRLTAPLPLAAVSALHRLQLAFAPALMEFPTQAGATVSVQSDGSARTPYTWTCSAGHDGGHAYASLPFCRDDAMAHAAECPGTIGASAEVVAAVTDYELAGLRAGALAGLAAKGTLSDLDADDLAHAEDLMAGARATLAAAGRLDLIGGA